MRSYLHVKGGTLWKVCAFVIMLIVITCCGTDIVSIDQPTTANVGDVVPITLNLSYCGGSTATGNLIVGVLMPNGWQGGSNNMTMAYTSTIGNGTLVQVSPTLLEKTTKQPWSAAMLNKFGIANNYINDMQWVVFQSDQAYLFSSVSTVTVNIKLKVGADNNNAQVNLAYVVAETNDGLQDPGADTYLGAGCNTPQQYEYYELKSAPRMVVSGGSGDNIDYADPQLTTIDPAKALVNDFLTVTFYGDIVATPLANMPLVYLNSTAYTTDGIAYQPVSSAITSMTETSSTSNIYKLSFWPKVYYGIPPGKTLERIEYLVTNQSGTVQLGVGGSSTKFVYKFKCQ